jgi:hypothetical protein
LIAGLDPEEWELPPKPKWMRWRAYNRLAKRIESYDDMTDDSTLPALVAKPMRRTLRVLFTGLGIGIENVG